MAMRADLTITGLEKLESKFKSLIRLVVNLAAGEAEAAFWVAEIQKGLGLIFKYKSYGIKACNPLGYSIFILNRGQGFSFQNHLSFKRELFNVLKVLPSGYLFVAGRRKWERCFEEDRFKRWLGGRLDARYDRLKIIPVRGGVVKINRTGIVHTVIGCILEEYANTSRDMVRRLYDQNYGKKIPEQFSRDFVERKLKKIDFPQKNFFLFPKPAKNKVVRSKKFAFGEGFVFNKTGDFVAARYCVYSFKKHRFATRNNYVSIYVTDGEGELGVLDNEFDLIRSFKIKRGETTLLVPDTIWYFKNISAKPLRYSFLSIDKINALK